MNAMDENILMYIYSDVFISAGLWCPPHCMAGRSTSEGETTPPFRNAMATTPNDVAP